MRLAEKCSKTACLQAKGPKWLGSGLPGATQPVFLRLSKGNRGFWGFPWNPETALAGLWWGKTAASWPWGDRSFLGMRGEAKSPCRFSLVVKVKPNSFGSFPRPEFYRGDVRFRIWRTLLPKEPDGLFPDPLRDRDIQ